MMTSIFWTVLHGFVMKIGCVIVGPLFKNFRFSRYFREFPQKLLEIFIHQKGIDTYNYEKTITQKNVFLHIFG